MASHNTEPVEALKRMMQDQATQHESQIAHLLAIIADLTAHPPSQGEHHLLHSMKKRRVDSPSTYTPHTIPNNYPSYCLNIQPSDQTHNCNKDVKKSTQSTNRPRRPPRQLTPLNFPRYVIFGKLVKEGILKPLPPTSPLTQPDPSYRADLYCEYHQGNVGHITNYCLKLKHKIQDLIYNKTIPPPPYLPDHQYDQAKTASIKISPRRSIQSRLGPSPWRSIQSRLGPRNVVPKWQWSEK